MRREVLDEVRHKVFCNKCMTESPAGAVDVPKDIFGIARNTK